MIKFNWYNIAHLDYWEELNNIPKDIREAYRDVIITFLRVSAVIFFIIGLITGIVIK